MADFDYEQLKTLFESLSNRLDKTKGDAEVASQISDMKKQIGDLIKKIDDKKDKKEQITDKDIKGLVDDLVSGVENAFRDSAKKQQAADAKNAEDLKRSIDKLADNKSSSNNSQGMLNIGLDAAGKSSSKFSKFLDKASEKVGYADRIIGGATTRLLNMDGTVTGLAEAFGVTSSTVLALTRHFDNEVGAFRDLQTTSEGSIRTIGEMHTAMSDAMMTSRELADAMRQGSDGARLFGAIEWATLSKNVRNATRDVGFFGYSLNDLADAQSGYLEILKDRGDLFNLDQKDITDQLVKLLAVNDKMAMILGKNRDEVLADKERANRNANLDLLLKGRGVSQDNKDAIDNARQFARQVNIGEIVDNLLASHGGAITDPRAATQFSLFPPEVQQGIKDLVDGLDKATISNEELPNVLQDFREKAERSITNNPAYAENIGRIGQFGNEDFTNVSRSLIAMTGLGKVGERGKEALPTKPEEMDQPTLNALKMQELAKQTQMNALMSVDKMLDEAASKFSGSIASTIDGLHSFNSSISDSIKDIDSLSSALGTFSLIAGATSIFSAISTIPGLLWTVKSLKGGTKAIGDLLAGGSKGATAATEAAGAAAVKGAGTAAEASTAGKAASTAANSADDAMASVGKAAKFAGKLKFLGSALAVTAEGVSAYNNISDAKAKKDSGQLTDEEYKKIFTEEIAKAVGGSGGSILLGSLGAALGAGAGSAVAPGPGTLVGGVAGGIGGGIAGMFGGEAAGQYVGSQLYDLMKDDAAPQVQPSENPEPAQIPQRQVTDLQNSLNDIQSNTQNTPTTGDFNTTLQPSEAAVLDKFGQQTNRFVTTDDLRSAIDQQKINFNFTPDDFKKPIEELQKSIEDSMSKNDDKLDEIKELLKSLLDEIHSGNVISQDKLDSIASFQERLTTYLRASVVQ